jgi:hypothetical protein
MSHYFLLMSRFPNNILSRTLSGSGLGDVHSKNRAPVIPFLFCFDGIIFRCLERAIFLHH